MIYSLINKKNYFHKYFYIFILFFGIFFHLIYLYQFDDYYDDWNFFYTVDPNVTNQVTWERHYFGDRGEGFLKEAYPWNFTYLTKYFLKTFGYTVETTHYFILIFSAFSYLIFFKLINLISKNFKFIVIALILFVTNLFFIRELNSFRPHSLVLMLSLLSNYYFIKIYILEKKKNINYFGYIFFSLGMLSFWPHTAALLAGHFSFLFIKSLKNNNYFSNLFLPVITLFFYILLNYKYIEYVLFNNSFSYTPFNQSFFLNFFFRSFFASIIFGASMLLIFAFYLINEFKINFINFFKNSFFNIPIFDINIKNFILINILSIYVSIIAFSFFKESVIAGKYFLFLLPQIIIWLSLKIVEKKNKLIYNIIFITTFLNLFYYWNDVPIDRPPLREVLRILKNNNIKNIYTTESIVFNNYLTNYRFAIDNKFSVKKIDNLSKENKTYKFALVCLNHPRAFYGKNYSNFEDPKCSSFLNKENNIILKKININDFIIFIVKPKN
jgi:hypothetical protein